nr:hypothetical protein Q903MT_gene2334 [Picea sitchensis]
MHLPSLRARIIFDLFIHELQLQDIECCLPNNHLLTLGRNRNRNRNRRYHHSLYLPLLLHLPPYP